jgi:acyl-coenzyme A thioesterase PaaI-like protein
VGRASGLSGVRTVEIEANLSRPIRYEGGRVAAKARVAAQTGRVISAEARATAGDRRALAHGTSTLIVVAGGK